MHERRAHRPGSTNVFADLGLPNPEEELLMAHLVHATSTEIRRRKLTQQRAAKLAGITQPELSRLVNGRWGGFSTDRLLNVVKNPVSTSRSRFR
jgi:predicted XRE-type DNA-binding protein